jgi:hypothetical protein
LIICFLLYKLLLKMIKITFQISDDLFWGFRVKVPICSCSVDEKYIINYVKDELCNFLQNNNLIELYIKAKEKKFHIHYPVNFNNLDYNDTYYICGHC